MTEHRESGERGHDEYWSNIEHVMLISNIFLSNDVMQSAKQKQSLLKFEYALFKSKV